MPHTPVDYEVNAAKNEGGCAAPGNILVVPAIVTEVSWRIDLA